MFRYFGSKASTSARIADLVGQLPNHASIADAFGGLGTIGAELRRRGHNVTTCDVLTFPHFFQHVRIACDAFPDFFHLRAATGLQNSDEIKEKLNKSYAPTSWLVTEFSTNRKFFTRANAIRIAGAWHQIVRWNNAGLLCPTERAFLVSSLLNSLDLVANTAGTYYAHLKEFHRKSLRPFEFKWLALDMISPPGTAHHGDALHSLSGQAFDVLYLDPPYNSRNYASYYHLPESLAMLRRPTVKASSASGVPIIPHEGSTNIRAGMTLSYIEKLLHNVDWETAVIHYCSDGLISLNDMKRSLKKFGKVKEEKIPALGYTTRKAARVIDHHVFIVR